MRCALILIWEFGSFGMTRCHSKNLMNPKKASRLNGARLAFAQGGSSGTRLVYLTPPVRVVTHADRIEATWTPNEMPFRYVDAPKLADNRSESDFPILDSVLKAGNRSTSEGRFASRFRSCATPMDAKIAAEIVRTYSQKRGSAPTSAIATHYTDALPSPPPCVDDKRERTYSKLFEESLAIGYAVNAEMNLEMAEDFKHLYAECGRPRSKRKKC
jgi:hypothetical protein